MSQIDLTDSELMDANRLLVELTAKYSNRPWSKGNAMSLQSEAEDRFREIGLKVHVKLLSDPPVIEVVDRITEFDLEKHIRDVNDGVADDFWDSKYPKATG